MFLGNKNGTVVLSILKPGEEIGKLFFQNASYKSPEFRDFIGHNVPDNIIINSKVVVDEFVPCPSNSPPVDCTVLTPKGGGKGRVENWRSGNALSPVPPHQTVRSVFPNTAFQSSSSRDFRCLSPGNRRRYLIQPDIFIQVPVRECFISST